MTQRTNKPSRRRLQTAPFGSARGLDTVDKDSTEGSSPFETLTANERELWFWVHRGSEDSMALAARSAGCSEADWQAFYMDSRQQLQHVELLHGLAQASNVCGLLELARLQAAAQLVVSQSVTDLERLMRVIERLAELEGEQESVEHGPDVEMTDLQAMMTEVSRLLKELEQELPELPQTASDLYRDGTA